MRKIAIAIVIAAGLLSTSAQAEYRRGNSGNNWVAPLVGGLIVGGIIAGTMSQRPAYGSQVYIDQPSYHTECRREPMFDQWNQLLGYQRRCYNVPNY